jgi:hypothetical protein
MVVMAYLGQREDHVERAIRMCRTDCLQRYDSKFLKSDINAKIFKILRNAHSPLELLEEVPMLSVQTH